MFNLLIQYLLIKKSSFFDQDFYLNTYPEISDSGIIPLIHYIKYGWKENRDPGPNFSTSWYLKTYHDVREAGVNPLFHYLKYGIKEGRQIKKVPIIKKSITSKQNKNSLDFMIIGAQRAGTTSLFRFLDLIPFFCGSMDKEVGFFSTDSLYNRGEDWYHQQFRSCYPGQLRFEATPEYLYYPFVPGRIKNYRSDLRFIVILRDPIERCYSAWKLFRNIHSFDYASKSKILRGSKKSENHDLASLFLSDNYPKFSEVVQNDLERFYQGSNILEPSFVRRGLYHLQLSHWFQYFNKSNFLFLEINELNNAKGLFGKLHNFLDLEYDIEFEGLTMQKYNKLSGQNGLDVDQETLDLLRNFYFEHNIKLFELINKHYDWNSAQ